MNIVPREGGNTFTGTFFASRHERQPAERQHRPGSSRSPHHLGERGEEELGSQPGFRRSGEARSRVVLRDRRRSRW
jgi:hypothetical protein